MAYSSLLGRYMARAYLTGNEGVRVLVPVDTARRALRNSRFHMDNPPREPGLEADWIGLDDRHLIIAEAKGSSDKGTTTWSGPTSIPKVLRNAIDQTQRTNVFRSSATTPLPAKRWAVASRWGNEQNRFEPTLLAWDPEEEPLDEADYRDLAKLLHQSDTSDILTGLGHPDAADRPDAFGTTAPIAAELPLLVGDQPIEAGFSAALGPIGIVPLREPADLEWVHRMRDLNIYLALASLSARYVRTISLNPRAIYEDALADPNGAIRGDGPRVAQHAGLTVAWPGSGDDIEIPRD